MNMSDGIRAVKERRRQLVRELRKVDAIVAAFSGLQGSRTNGATPKAAKVRKPRKSSPRARKVVPVAPRAPLSTD